MNFENTTLEKKSEEKNMENEKNNERIVVENHEEVSAADLAEADLKASEKVEEARKSIFGRIGEMFKGKEKTEEEKYEEDMKNLEKLIKSLTHTVSVSMNLGASFGGGAIEYSRANTPQLKEKLEEIVEVNKQLSKMDKGKEKVDLMYKKRDLIQELARIGRTEIKNRYNKAA